MAVMKTSFAKVREMGNGPSWALRPERSREERRAVDAGGMKAGAEAREQGRLCPWGGAVCGGAGARQGRFRPIREALAGTCAVGVADVQSPSGLA